MAYSFSSQSAAVQAAIAADNPVIMHKNGLAGNISLMEWDTSGTIGIPDETDDDFPTTAAYDGHTSIPTKPNVAANDHYLIAQLTAGITFNAVAVWLRCDSSTTVSLQVADDNAFSTNLRTIAQWTVSETWHTRRAEFDLGVSGGDYWELSSVAFARLHFTGVSLTPAVLEWYLGDSLVALNNPVKPWAVDHETARTGDFVRRGGKRTRYVDFGRRKALGVTFNPDDSSQISDFDAAFGDIIDGQHSGFVWSDAPSSDANRVHLMKLASHDFQGPEAGGVAERRYSFQAFEQGPWYAGEDRGI